MRTPVLMALGAALCLGVGASGCGASAGTDAQAPFDGPRALADLRAQVEHGPRPAGSRAGAATARLLAGRLRQAGARDVRVQRPWRNVTGLLPGRLPGSVIVGAHYDTKEIPGFVGANDGASGAAVVLELARTLPRRPRGPSIAFVLFDAEEAPGRDFERGGDRGSRQYVAYARRGGAQGAVPIDRIRAMVLFDMVGDCDLQVPREANSDPALYDLFARAAGPEPFVGVTGEILDDHTPFERAGVPAVDLIDFTYGSDTSPGPWWHTGEDALDKVCADSLAAVGGAALEAIPRIR